MLRKDWQKECSKTRTGKHIFFPIEDERSLSIWRAHGVENPLKCMACGIINVNGWWMIENK